MLNSDAVKVSHTYQKEPIINESVVLMKKWSKIGSKLVFKLNSKLMQIIRADKGEILLKYDTGVATFYKSQSEVNSIVLPEDVKQLLFSSSHNLNKKIETIEALFIKTEVDLSHKYSFSVHDSRKFSAARASTENNGNERSTKGFSSEMNFEATPKFRSSRYKTVKQLSTHHQSMNMTPFKQTCR